MLKTDRRDVRERRRRQENREAILHAAERVYQPDFRRVDGFKQREGEFGCPQLGIPGADRKSLTVAAASILAKVVRDEIIGRVECFFTGYCLERNKGYGTKEHYLALREKGPTSLHRLTFNLEGKDGWG